MNHSQLSCQRQNSTLASCVRQLGCSGTNKTNNTGSVDNACLLLSMLAEAQNRMLATEPYTLDVDGLCQIPDLLWCVDRVVIVSVHYAGVVEDDVQTAPGVDVGDHSLDVSFLGDIADLGLNLQVFGAGNNFMQLGQCLLEGWPGDVAQEDVGALTCEENRCLETNAAALR